MKQTSFLTVILLCTVLPIKCLAQVECETSLSDFREISKDKLFIDKTLLIRELFTRPAVKVVRAPPRFGKSTIIDMIRRFLEINIDSKGRPVPDVTETENFKLFHKGKKIMRILRHNNFVKKHFGQHPVMLIDCKHLSSICNFDDILCQLRSVLKRTFMHHEYLLQNSSLWLTAADKQLFTKYLSQSGSLTLTEPEIKAGFTFLANTLHRHFRRKVYVLIDDYDAFVHNLLFTKVSRIDDIFSFVGTISASLLKANEDVLGAFLTGVFHVRSGGLSLSAHDAEDYNFLGNHHFAKYYGVTGKELTATLNQRMRDVHVRNRIKSVIKDYYHGYRVQEQNINIYSIWSLVNFMKNKNKPPQSYWCKSEYLDSFSKIFSVPEISDIMKNLILGKTIDLDISIPLSKNIIAGLNELNKNLKIKQDTVINQFFVLLYNLGYLTPSVEDNMSTTTSHLVTLKVPNQEIMFELSIILQGSYSHHFDRGTLQKLYTAIDSFRPYQVSNETFYYFYKTLSKLFKYSYQANLKTVNDAQSVILSLVIQKFPMSKAVDLGSIAVLITNSYRVVIVIETKMMKTNTKDKRTARDKIALEAYEEIFSQGYNVYIDKNLSQISGKIYVGLCFEKDTGKISIAYSSCFNETEDYEHPIVMNLDNAKKHNKNE